MAFLPFSPFPPTLAEYFAQSGRNPGNGPASYNQALASSSGFAPQ
jgi:hypothetical protein